MKKIIKRMNLNEISINSGFSEGEIRPEDFFEKIEKEIIIKESKKSKGNG